MPPTVPFHDLTELEFLQAGGGTATVRAPNNAKLKNHFGTMHGGMLYTVGEVAAAVAITRMLGDHLSSLRAVTRSGQIEYLKPARGAVTGKSQVRMTVDQILEALNEQSSVTVPIDVTLMDDDGVEVGQLYVEWFVGKPLKQ